jgi:Uma2 family endonuclease
MQPRYDRIRKQRLYATAGIPEYWVANVKGEWVEVYRLPEGKGFPDVVIAGADIFA